ncbi:hypothetical protein CkaCkLH20_03708 [Colletotrichum karsti]|uniref:Uncharacterized protein n=1 Tax=Colletotrichum karsti TaxID=1095194 RepID=A0A9P6I9H6_9PEZI|nr:uncharacterized protein CkaCkLH20_03708 [Colletotrichum karsti]KAF9878808.1 hypothetical protein CkaCkLH20_03708 [Colletotrichum karsti]
MASHAILSDNVWNFGNLPFSSGVKANHYPPDIQARQVENIHVPTWAMMPMNTLAGASSVKDSISVIYHETKAMIASGIPADAVTGTDCNVAAIFDRNEYEKTSMLSQWAARIIYSVRHKSNDFTSLAACYLMWVLMRWMVNPRPDTY